MKAQVVEIGVARKAKLVDEFGQLDLKVREFSPIKDRYEALRKEIQSWYENSSAGASFEAEGKAFLVTAGPRGMKRRLKGLAGLAKALKKKFWDICTVKLEDLDAYVAEPERSKYVIEEQTGPRKVTVAPKLPKAA